jgi:DNA-directed DNA polymerase III PolC
MMHFPQLRVRTGYTYRDVYGRMPEVFERLKELGAKSAAIVDMGTWGHVRWEKEAAKHEIQPLFGMEFPVKVEEDAPLAKFSPRAWMLGKDTRSLYRATTASVQGGGLSSDSMSALEGVIRFPGGALQRLKPEAYDYVDVNPASFLHASSSICYAKRHGKPMVITSYNDMPHSKHSNFAYAWEVRDSVGCRTIEGVDALYGHLRHVMGKADFDKAVENTFLIEEQLAGIKLQKAPLIHLDGDLIALAREGQASRLARGHIQEWTQVYEDRFNEEIHQIQLKKFDSYFLVVADLVSYAKQHMLVGPARGSAAGSLVCYVLGITEVDPIPHDLLFQRFIDISRADLPDIDIDFNDTKRWMVFEYLQNKYGAQNVAKLGNINTLKAASVIQQVRKKFNIPEQEAQQIRNSLIEYSSGDARYGKGLEDTFAGTEPGKEFRANYPEASACMGDLEIHPSHTGVHAAGILVCNEPISDFCTVNADGVGQIDKPDSEYLDLLKIDALGLRTLGIIEDAGVTNAEELYGLKLDDPAVFEIINQDKVSGIFQFEGDAVRSVTRSVDVDRFSKIDNLTALARPGPLASGMAQKYIERSNGREAVTYDVPHLEKYLKDTYGVFLYQEQIMSVVKEIGLFDWVKTSAVRKAMSGRKGEEYFNQMGADFVTGAMSQGVPEDQAKKIWNEMVTFGSWGFNKSHSVSYAVVTYWTCWLKCYHKLEFAAACLRSAKDDEQTIAILRELAKEGVNYTPIDPEHSGLNWVVADGRLIGGIMNAKGFGPSKAEKFIQLRDSVKESIAFLASLPITPETLEDLQDEVDELSGRLEVAKEQADKELAKLLKADLADVKRRLKDSKAQYKEMGGEHIKRVSDWNKAAAALASAEVQFADLAEAHTKFGHYYADPRLAGVVSGNPIIGMKDVKDRDDGLIIGKLTKKVLADENEAIRIKKRGGKRKEGLTQFLDLMMVDDSTDSPMRFRIRPDKFVALGKPIAEGATMGSWFLVKGWKISDIDMFIVKNIKRIYTQAELVAHEDRLVKLAEEGEEQ